MLLRKKYKNTFKSEFGKNVITLFTGTSIAQILPVLISPFLTRLYSPADFGVAALFVAITGFIAIIITGQYENAIMLPKDDDDSINLIGLCLILTLTISVLTLCIVFFFNGIITSLLNNIQISKWLYLIPISVFISGIFQTLNMWNNRKKKFRRLALRQVSQSVSTNLVKLGLGIVKIGSAGLIIGGLIGQITATSVLSLLTYKEIKNKLKIITKETIIKIAKKYKDFPQYLTIQSFLDIFRINSIIFIISFFYDSSILGLYSLAFILIILPAKFIGNSISQVFFQKASNAYNHKKDIWVITKKLILYLALIGLPFFLIIILWGPNIYGIVFGEKWRMAGTYSQILAPMLFLNFIISHLGNIPLILNEQKKFFVFSLFNNIFLPIVFFVPSFFMRNILYSIFSMSFAGSLYFIISIFWIKRLIKQKQFIVI